MDLTHRRCLAVRIFQHLVDEPDLDDLVAIEQVGILGGIATEHLLKLPVLVPGIVVVFVILIPLRLLDTRPVEHLHVLPVGADEEHRQRGGVVLLDDTVYDSGYCHRVITVGRCRLSLVLTTDHHCHRADGQKHEFLHMTFILIQV